MFLTEQQLDAFARKMMSDLITMDHRATYSISLQGNWNHSKMCTERILTNHTSGYSYLVYSTQQDQPGTYSIAKRL